MLFRIREHVKASRLGWYGQIVEILEGHKYKVRVGGTNIVHVIAEGDLEPIIPGRRVAPIAFPPRELVKDGGYITLPSLAYAFSNEKGLSNEEFWRQLQAAGVDAGAFVGVSGSILDFACQQKEKCCQIISTDINTETVDAVDILRTIVGLLGNVTSIIHKKIHFKLKTETNTRVNSSEFLQEVIGSFRINEAGKTLDAYDLAPADKGDKIKSALLQLQKMLAGNYKMNFSSWFRDEDFIVRLGMLIARGRFGIICGDLQNIEFQRAVKAGLQMPIALFNFSNALDYIRKPEVIATLFSSIAHTMNAKIVTSSQVEALIPYLGTFDKPKILGWDALIHILRIPELRPHFGRLLDVA